MRTGQDLVNLAKTRIGNKYVLGTSVPKDDSSYQGPWDCAEFVSWCYYQLTNKLYGCENNNGSPHSADAYTGYLDRDAHKIGKIITIEQANNTPGALLLRVAANGVTGHVVICEGNPAWPNRTVEANSTKYGVIESHTDNRRWDYGILFPELNYTEDINARPTIVQPVTYRLTNPIMVSDNVGKIQEQLGFTGSNIDCKYGIQTFTKVKLFQINHGLVADGEVGTVTGKELGLSILWK